MADAEIPHFSGDTKAKETTSSLSVTLGAVEASKKKSRQGSKTSSVRSSSTKLKQIESDQAKKMAELKRDYASKVKKLQMAQHQLQKLQGDLASMVAVKNSPEWTQDMERDERQLHREIRKCEYDLGTHKAEVKFMEETMEADINVIKADAELEKEKAMSEEENGSLSDDDVDQSKAEMVESWKQGAQKAQQEQAEKSHDQPYYDEAGAHVYSVSYVDRTTRENQRYNDNLMRQGMQRASMGATFSTAMPRDSHYEQVFQPRFQQQQRSQYHHQNYHNPNPGGECSGNQGGNGSGDVVSQLVTALGTAFGGRQHDVVVKSGADKELPKFNGNPANWETFRSEYQRTTTKYKIDKSENLTRLRRSLEGQALAAVEHLLSTPNNIGQIWKSLEQRFGRPEFILEYLIAKAKGTRSPDENKPETVIAFGTAIEALVTNICSYNQKDYLLNRQLVNEFASKLSGSMKISWYEWLSDDSSRQPTLHYFSQWLERKVNAAILSVKPTVYTSNLEEKRSKRGPGAVNMSTGEEKGNGKECFYCEKSNHTIGTCWKFKKIPLSERWEKVKQLKLCVCCLEKGHRSKSCKNKKECAQANCTYLHHPLLHSDKPKKSQEISLEQEDSTETDKKTSEDKADGAVSLVQGCDGPLAIIPARVKGPNGTRKVHVFLDNGASRSLITKKLAKELGIHGETTNYSYRGITGNKVIVEGSEKVQFQVAGVYRGATFHNLYAAVTIDQIPLKPYSIDVEEIKRKFPHLRKAKCQNIDKIVPDVIIGNNNPNLWLARETLAGNEGEPVAWRSVLGWSISGNMDTLVRGGSINLLLGETSDDYLHNLIKQNFFLDNHGVKVPSSLGINPDEKRAYSILEATTKKVGNKWETGLLWRKDDVKLPDSEREAILRLKNQEQRMKKDPKMKKLYCAKFDEYRNKGYIQKLTLEETVTKTDKTNYISHFGVTNVNKPGKLRLVFNAAAKIDGISLNDNLLSGPDLIRPLAAVLWNFRKFPYEITGDISGMFHRVGVRAADQDSQRFLWRDGDDKREPEHYRMVVLIFGATSSPCSAIYTKNKNAMSFQDEYPEACDAIVNSFYVDDCLHSAKTVEAAIKIRKEINFINEAGGFTVCKWMSNSPEVLATIPENLRADGIKNLNEKSSLPTERVLGSWWDPNLDVITFKVNFNKVSKEILEGKQPTKREVSRLVMSIFDPLGIVNHYKIKGLIILQDIWRTGIGWDDEVSSDIYDRWKEWLGMLPDITKVRLPRMYTRFLDDHYSLEIHTFVDSSEEGYCAVSYLRAQKYGIVEVAFMGSKVRVASLKKQTIPRLELQAALLGARLANSLQDELKLNLTGRTFWSDSKTVLLWIRGSAIKYKEYVANRVGEIQETTDVAEWKWVPTALNVADLATRFTSEIGFTSSCQWFTGPDFLQGEPSSFPKERDSREGIVSLVTEDVEVNQDNLTNAAIFDVRRFSSYQRCLRTYAAFQRVVKFWMWKALKKGKEVQHPWKNKTGVKVSRITSEDIIKAEISIIRQVQQDEFKEEWDALVNGRTLSKKCKLYKLSPVIHDGVIRIRSRIMGAPHLKKDVRMPIILPSRHKFTELLVDHEHAANAHQGAETVLSNLRQRFWILDGRQTVKRSWSRCLHCKLKFVKPIIPEMGELPHYRLASHRLPFSFTGMDLFGPIEVTVGRRREKRWGVIMCCMVTRAVHLEVVYNLSTDEIIMAVSRFIDTRGRPQMILSDNGTNLVGASNELKREYRKINFDTVAANGKFHPIQWRFNPPGAPHFGGTWERLIQTVKKCMYTLLKEKHPRDTTLLTTFKAIENMMNSRPLTYLSSDPDDPQALTPNHILRGGSDAGPAIPALAEKRDEYLRCQWRRSQLFADQFWERWTREYLPKLQPREKWLETKESLVRGDLVFLVGENAPRNTWKRGVITDIFPGADGCVRVVEVAVPDGDGKKTYRRPVSKVCPLGLRMGMQG